MQNLNLDKLSKSVDGRKTIIESLADESVNAYLLRRDLESWQLYHNTGDVKEFEYLRVIGDYELPSKVRRIPVQRAKANSLISQKSRKASKWEVRVTDKESIMAKNERIFHALIYITGSQIRDKRAEVETQVISIDQQLQELQQLIQREPETEEEAAQIEMVRRQMPFIMHQLNQVKDALQRGINLTNKEIEEVDKFFKSSYKDILEEYGEKLILKLDRELDLHSASVKNFVSKIVTGRSYYFVDYQPGDKRPTYKALTSMRVIFPSIEGVRWTHHGPWVGYNEHMSKEQIRSSFVLTPEQLSIVDGLDENTSTDNSGAFIAAPGQAVYFDGNAESSNTSGGKYVAKQQGIEVRRRWWVAHEKLTAHMTPNKYEQGKYFISFIKDKKIISSDDYKWDNRKRRYVNRKDDKDSYDKKEVVVYNPNKGEKIETRYFQVRYRGARIGNHAKLAISEKDPIQPRFADDYTKVMLPIVGRTYSGVEEYPYSIFWSTRELQKQYWVVSYFRELTFALAGASGVVFDMSQKPDGMSDDNWFYQMKMGRYLIQTISQTGAKKNTGYNQFSRVDQTLPSSIQYFDNVLAGLDFQIGQIFGVPRQRMGEVVPTDQVGTFQMSNEQAHLVTEILYYEHDEVESEAVKLLLNIAVQYVYKPGDILDIPGEVATTMTIPDFFDETRFDISAKTSVMDEVKLKELKGIANLYAQKGVLPFEFASKIFSIDSLKEMQREVAAQTEKQREIMALQQQQGVAAEAEAEQKSKEMEQQFEGQMKMIETRLDEAKMKLDAKLKQTELMLKNKEITLTDERQKEKNMIDAQQTVDEKEVEGAMIQENQRSNIMNERLKAIELQIEAITGTNATASGTGGGSKRMPEHLNDN